MNEKFEEDLVKKYQDYEESLELEDIVPGYYSKCWILKKFSWQRLYKSIEIVLPFLDFEKNLKILDAGCGSGHLMSLLKEKTRFSLNKNIIGIDYNKNLFKLKAKDNEILIVRGDLTQLPFKDDTFDIIFCLDVLEHIYEIEKAILALKNALKKEGLLIVCQPTEDMWYRFLRLILRGHWSPAQHWKGEIRGFHYWKASQIKEILKKYFYFKKTQKIKFLFITLNVIWLLEKK